MGGRELANPGEGRPIRQHRPDRERLDERQWIQLAGRRRMAEERLRLRGEAEVATKLGDKEGADTEAVAGKENLPLLTVPERDGEVAVESLQAVDAPLLVCMDDHFGVARRVKAVAEPLQLCLKLDVVVDLAVLHHPVPAVLVRERLVAAAEVDDCEARA